MIKIKTHKSKIISIFLVILFLVIINDNIFRFSLLPKDNAYNNNETNLKIAGSWELFPFIIDDGGGGDYTWAEAVMEEWCSGSGTSINPYIIANITIDGLASQNCITIRSSSVYFIIRDSIFYNGKIGIYLANIDNGMLINNTCYSNSNDGISLGGYDTLIINNTIYSNGDEGIYIIGSRNTISDNIINNNNLNGIKLEGTGEYNTISNNIINDNRNDEGIYLFGGSNNLIKGNNINRNGIELSEGWDYGCYNNNITGNIINNGGVSIHGDTVIEVASHYIYTSNLVNGKPLYYYTDEVGLDNSDFENAGQVILVNCRDSLISNLDVSNTSYPSGMGFSYGILLYYSTNNTISNNTASFCNIGIELRYSNDNTIEDNIVSNNNRKGLYTTYSSNSIVLRNIANNNTHYGIDLNGDNNIVSGNTMNNNQYVGIRLGGDNNIVLGNTANNNENRGIYSRGTNNTISSNTANYNEQGIYIDVNYNNNTITGNIVNYNYYDGIYSGSEYNIISNNTIYKNGRFGIWLYYSKNNIIKDNNIEGSIKGIRLYYYSDNNIILKNILKNNEFGVIIDEGSPSAPYPSNNNLIYNNNFIGNNINGEEDQGTNNQWDNGTFGNYWDDYSGVDADDDGIGDTPYSVGGGAVDNYPIWWDAPIIEINTPHINDIFEESPNFNVSIVEGIADTTWYSLDDGLTNITFIGLTGKIDETEWDALPDGNVIIRFYANDSAGNIGFAEVTIKKDVTAPTININSPNLNELFGISAPSFNIEIYDANLASMWYTLDNGLTNTTFTTNGTIYQPVWDSLPDGTLSIIFYANDTAGNIGFSEVAIRKDVNAPVIAINNPQNSDVIGALAPNFDLSIEEPHLDYTWYSLNGGNNITFTGLTGTIDQALWDALHEGNVIIRFYANDSAGNIGFQEVTVAKMISQSNPPGIPGYNIILLLGIVSTITVIIVKKRLNHLN